MVNDGIGACACVEFPTFRFIRGVGGSIGGVVAIALVVCVGCCGSSNDGW